MTPKTKVTNARCRVLIKDPWYGTIASRMVWISQPEVGTMGVRFLRNGKIQCAYAPKFVDELSIEQIIAVIKHEIEHIIRMHLPRGKTLSHDVHTKEVWNIAADWVINGPKNSKRIPDLPDCGAFIPTKDDPGVWSKCDIKSLEYNFTTEQFYDWIMENTEYKSGNVDDGFTVSALYPKGSKNPISVDAGFDNHEPWADSEVSSEDMRNIAKDLARAATQASGSTPGHLTESISKLEKPKINFMYLLRNVIGRAAGGKRFTFAKRHRKRDAFGIKGKSHRNRIPLNICVDVSGSVSKKMIQKFFGEIERASNSFKIKLITFDTVVTSVSDYHKGDWKSIELKGRGGTSFEACLNYLENNNLVGKLNIIFTDGYDIIPEKRPYQVLWVVVGSAGKRYLESQELWGECILIEHDEDI